MRTRRQGQPISDENLHLQVKWSSEFQINFRKMYFRKISETKIVIDWFYSFLLCRLFDCLKSDGTETYIICFHNTK